MSAAIFLVLVGTFFAGIALVLAGRRGRKLNDHPQCRWCGFDLDGVYPAHVTCPECGAGLKRERAVRIGVRKRMGGLIGVGVALAMIPLAPIAIALYAGATGVNLNEYKPVWLLLFEGSRSRPSQSAAIAQELLSRMQLKTVDAETSKRIAAVALELQENAKGAWAEDWGDVIEQARADRLLATDDLKRYRRNSMVITFRARATVRAGDPLPVEATLAEARCGSASSMSAQLVAAKASLDGTIISRPAFSQQQSGFSAGLLGIPGSTVMNKVPVAVWWITGSKSPMTFGGQRQAKACWDYKVPKDLAPGRHELEVQVSAQVDDSNAYGGAPGAIAGETRRNGRLFTFKAFVEVLPADAPTLPPITLSPDQDAQLRATLQPSSVVGYRQERNPGRRGAATTVQITFNLRDLPAPVARRVIIVIDGKEHKAGQIASGSAASSDYSTMWYNGVDEHSRMVYATIPKLDLKKTKTIDIILRPDPSAAARMLDPTGVYGGELVLKDVAITDQSSAYFGVRQSEAASGTGEAEVDPSTGEPGAEPEAKPDE